MSEGLLDAIFATSTVAAGVDFPARTVAFLNSDRFNGREFVPLDATELHQMTGRAGRRGKDHIGFAMVVPGKYMDVRRVARLFNANPADVHSQIRINFSMTLNLLLSHTPEEVEALLHHCFAAFQRHGVAMGGEGAAHNHLWTDFQRHLHFLQERGYADHQGRLTEDGLWASQLRIDQPLLVAEGLRDDLFPKDAPALLAGIMAGLVNDRETDDHIEKKRYPQVLTQALNLVSRGLKGISKHMLSRGFEVRRIYMRPVLAVYHWASDKPWDKTIEAAQMAEGDLAMLVMRTADNLRHMAALQTVFPEMARAARQAIDLILREPVLPDYGNSDEIPAVDGSTDPQQL